MQPFGVLDRYIGKTIFTTIMMTLFMLVSLSWDAGAAQRTGSHAGFWFYPYAGGAVGDENRHSAGLADDGDW